MVATKSGSSLGQRVKQVRQEKNLTQEALAKKVGVTRAHVSQVETGLLKRMQLATLTKYADALNVSPSYLEWNDESKTGDVTQDFYNLIAHHSGLEEAGVRMLWHCYQALLAEMCLKQYLDYSPETSRKAPLDQQTWKYYTLLEKSRRVANDSYKANPRECPAINCDTEQAK